MKIIAKTLVEHDMATPLKNLRRSVKSLTGFDLRRMDSFTLVAMQATYLLLKDFTPKGSVGLYGVANYFSVELLQSLIKSVEQKQDIRPFDFILSVGNAANFYLAKQFEMNGPNIFLGSSSDPKKSIFELIGADASFNLIDYAVFISWMENETRLECHAKLIRIKDAV